MLKHTTLLGKGTVIRLKVGVSFSITLKSDR